MPTGALATTEDHLVPLDLGGAPYDPRNLWPEPRATADGWNADVKDELEAVLSRLVCSGRVPLAEAQRGHRCGLERRLTIGSWWKIMADEEAGIRECPAKRAVERQPAST